MGLIDQPMQLCKKSFQKIHFWTWFQPTLETLFNVGEIPSPASLASSNFGMPVKRVTRLVLASQRQRQRWGEPTTFRRRLELLSQVNFGLGHGGHQNEIHHPTSGNLEIKMLQPTSNVGQKLQNSNFFKGLTIKSLVKISI